jgi:hypothetical protein
MDEINIAPKHYFRLPSGLWLLAIAAVALIATTATLLMTIGGGRPVARPLGSAANPAVFTCAQTSNPPSKPRPGDLIVGPLWIINARDSTDPKGSGPNPSHEYKYPIGVRPGTTVTLTIAPPARGHVVIDNPYLPSGVTAATYRACSPISSPGWSVFAQGFAFTDGRTRGCVPLTVQTGRQTQIRKVTISLYAGHCTA